MKKFAFLFIFFAITINAQTKKVLFVIVDGIPADVVEKIKTPTLDKIAKIGGYRRAYVGGEKGKYSETPTISAVGYNSLLTGTWVNKHNVIDNKIENPNYNYWTIFRFLKAHYPQKTIAIFSTWEDNRKKLVGDNLAETGYLKIDYHFDGLELDEKNFPHDDESLYIHKIDKKVTETASNSIRQDSPDLTWCYLQYTDDMGHKYGDSEKFYESVRIMDSQIARLWEAIEFRQKNFNEDWLVFITTDHGRDAKTGTGHGKQTDRERKTWITTNAKNLNGYFQKYKPAIVDILPSITSFLDIKIPTKQLMEIDGVSLINKVSAIHPKAVYRNGQIYLSWKAVEKNGEAKIWLSETNNFQNGKNDDYKLVKTISLNKGKVTIDVKNSTSKFFKIVIETPDNFLNRWVYVDD